MSKISKLALLAVLPCTFLFLPETSHARRLPSYTVESPYGWPEWIGRLEKIPYKSQVQFSQKYLPLSLIRTGRFEEIVEEIRAEGNTATSDWPEWIGEVGQ